MKKDITVTVHMEVDEVDDMIFGSDMLQREWWGDAKITDDGRTLIIDAIVPISDVKDGDWKDGDGKTWRTYRVPVWKVAEEMISEAESDPTRFLDLSGEFLMLDIGDFGSDTAGRCVQRAVFGGVVYG